MTTNKEKTGKKKTVETIIIPDTGKIQPQAIEFEKVVLGALMLERDAYASISEILRPECFYESKHEMIFKSIMNPEIGLLNSFLRLLGIAGLKWLTDPKMAFGSVMGVDIWKGMGYIMTIFIAGIMSIDPTYYEAADIDGAGAWRKFRTITLPMLMPTITVTTVLNIIYGLKVFDMVYALTNGGPGYATEVLYTSIYKEFGFGRYAVGTTLSSIMFVFMVIVGYFLIRLMTRNEVPE